MRTQYEPESEGFGIMVLLIIDPGVTTGLAVINEFGTVLASDNAQESELPYKLNSLIDEFLPNRIIIEEVGTPTLSPLNQQLGRVKAFCKVFFPLSIWVKAADWKQTPAATMEVPLRWKGEKLTTHQKDSIRIGKWYLRFRLHRA